MSSFPEANDIREIRISILISLIFCLPALLVLVYAASYNVRKDVDSFVMSETRTGHNYSVTERNLKRDVNGIELREESELIQRFTHLDTSQLAPFIQRQANNASHNTQKQGNSLFHHSAHVAPKHDVAASHHLVTQNHARATSQNSDPALQRQAKTPMEKITGLLQQELEGKGGPEVWNNAGRKTITLTEGAGSPKHRLLKGQEQGFLIGEKIPTKYMRQVWKLL